MKPRFSACGTGALLMDVAEGPFDLRTQQHLWSLAAADSPLRKLPQVRNTVLGVNNLLVGFDPFVVHPQEMRKLLEDLWNASEPFNESGRMLEVPVVYDVAAGSELVEIARQVRLSVEEVIRLHTSVDYHVACVGSVPGFGYLVGMPARLAVPRHATPRPRMPKGAVAIGGAQTGIIPMEMPSGWRVLGMTELEMFDPNRARPSLLSPGDRIRFIPAKGST